MLVNKLRTISFIMLGAAAAPWLFWVVFEWSNFASKSDELFLWLAPHTAPSLALGAALLVDTVLSESKRKVRAFGGWGIVLIAFLAACAAGTLIVLMHCEHQAAMARNLEPGKVGGFALLDSKGIEFVAAAAQMVFDGVTMALVVKVALADDSHTASGGSASIPNGSRTS